jgi:hypothetical protein
MALNTAHYFADFFFGALWAAVFLTIAVFFVGVLFFGGVFFTADFSTILLRVDAMVGTGAAACSSPTVTASLPSVDPIALAVEVMMSSAGGGDFFLVMISPFSFVPTWSRLSWQV